MGVENAPCPAPADTAPLGWTRLFDTELLFTHGAESLLKRIAPLPLALLWVAVLSACPQAGAHPAAAVSQPLSEAWWTGPLLAPNAATLPPGHLYLEPYLYDAMPYARFDARGRSRPTAFQHAFGSLTYMSYGLTPRVTIGLIPRFGYLQSSSGASSASIGLGDLTVQAQYRLSAPDPHSGMPIASINLQESLPTGRYQRLHRLSDGFGSGAFTTTVSAYLMAYYWLPTGRILRTRLDLSYAISSEVPLAGLSVYGTPAGFHGRAYPGNSAYADLGLEYSMTRNWVLACDLWAQQDASTRVLGTVTTSAAQTFTRVARRGFLLYVAPALEYNWSARLGVIFGIRVAAAGRNETATLTPIAALSYFH